MCCPLYGAAERVPTEQVVTPYLGRRPSNPGEVIERGSLPFDQGDLTSRAVNSEYFASLECGKCLAEGQLSIALSRE